MMYRLNGGRPGDERGFLHKTLLGGISKIAGAVPLPGASLVSGITGRLAGIGGVPGSPAVLRRGGFRRGRGQPLPLGPVPSMLGGFGRAPARSVVPRSEVARPSAFTEAGKAAGRVIKFGGGETQSVFGGPRGRGIAPCDFPMVRDSAGRCRTPTSGEFGGPQFEVGAAVMGRYGAALEPGSMIIDKAVCLRGMQLGDDGLCYNKGQISNKQRMWPAGRKPLLTGGEMRAISVAARAGRRLEGATKRLQRLGMMKKPTSRRAVPAGHRAKLVHASQHD